VELLNKHIFAIRKIPSLEQCNVIVMIESNFGKEYEWVARDIQNAKIKDVYFMEEDKDRPGIRTDNQLKINMAVLMNEKLRNNELKIFEHFICVGYGEKKITTDTMKKDLFDQLRNFSKIVIQSRDIYKEAKVFYSGKDGNGYDDHVIALGLVCTMFNRFRTNAKYKYLQ